MEFSAELALQIAEVMLPVLVALLGFVSVKFTSWIKAKTKNEMVGGMLTRLVESSMRIVKGLEQSVVRKIKEGRAPDSPGGTKLTEEEQEEVAEEALISLHDYWGIKGCIEICSVLGLDKEEVTKLFKSHIESAVLDMNVKDKDKGKDELNP